MLGFWPNWWDDWILEHKVSFSGVEKIIYLHPDVTTIDVKEDIYSAWKEWVLLRDNSRFLEAIRVVGGDPITNIVSLGATYFLINGWKIRPAEGSYSLAVNGNLYSDDGLDPFINTLGDYNVRISMNRSNLIDTVSTGGGSGGLTVAENAKLMSLPSAATIATAVSAEIYDIIRTDPSIELSSIPNTTAPLATQIQFIFQYFRNKRTVTNTTERMYKENASTVLGSSALNDDGTTFTKSEMA